MPTSSCVWAKWPFLINHVTIFILGWTQVTFSFCLFIVFVVVCLLFACYWCCCTFFQFLLLLLLFCCFFWRKEVLKTGRFNAEWSRDSSSLLLFTLSIPYCVSQTLPIPYCVSQTCIEPGTHDKFIFFWL